jgi:hypothetical protein
LVEQVFHADVGICDPRLTDYLSQMLTEFVHADDVFRVKTLDGDTIRDVSQMRADAYLGPDVAEKTRRRVVNRYIGDFTLFWTGIYPEHLQSKRRKGDQLTRYLVEGKRSYGIASELSDSHEEPPGELLNELAEQFESCVHGLHLVRVGWEQLSEQRLSN